MNNAVQMLDNYRNLIESTLKEHIKQSTDLQKSVKDAMSYSLFIGGKRIRPALLLEFCRVCGGDVTNALNFACAIEMIHTYSLIHDDLPCMDNSDLRRGKASCHKVFGEDIALLAGDALLTQAFEIALKTENIPSDRIVRAAVILARASGADGMIGGQVIDLESEGKAISLNTLLKMYSLKTGALIKAAATIGCVLAGADQALINAAEAYSENIGLCFQIVDDILDLEGDEATLGKPTGSDERNRKSTYVTLNGLEDAKLKAKDLAQSAKTNLKVFGSQAKALSELAEMLTKRDS